MTTPAKPTPTPVPGSNPFAGSAPSPFSTPANGNPPPPGTGTPPARPPFSPPTGRPGAPPPPSGGLFSRFGARANFEYLPLHDTLVMFSLADVAEALYTALDISMPVKEDGTIEPKDFKPLIAALESSKALCDQLRVDMAAQWETIGLVGAVHVYDWREEVKVATNSRLQAIKAQPRFIRAADPMFVLNVLSRARSYLLLPDSAMALDRPFLERTLMSDDPRLLNAARNLNHKEDLLVEPPPPLDEVFEDDDFDDDDDDSK